jgi:hypothetical protein
VATVVAAASLAPIGASTASAATLGSNNGLLTGAPPIGQWFGLVTTGRQYSVTTFGADPTGQHDSTTAIRAALLAAEATPGPNVVYFPSGTYILNDNDGQNFDFKLQGPNPVIVEGAGMATTKIVEEVGLAKYPSIPMTKGVFLIAQKGGSGSQITGVTVDSQTYTAGTALADYGSYTTIDNDTFLGAPSSPRYNPDVFDARVIGVCNHTDNVKNGNNYVSNLVLNGRGSGGNVDLDISCQYNDQVSNIQDTGNGMALYIDSDISVSNLTYTAAAGTEGRPYQITAPSDHISLTGVTTDASGGVVMPSPNGYLSTDISISNETMANAGYGLAVGDVSNLTISNSKLMGLRIDPYFTASDINLLDTSYKQVTCAPAEPTAAITSLSGINC